MRMLWVEKRFMGMFGIANPIFMRCSSGNPGRSRGKLEFWFIPFEGFTKEMKTNTRSIVASLEAGEKRKGGV